MLLLPLAGAPSLLLGLRTEKLLEQVRLEQAEARRSLALLFELATTAPAGKEVRVFDLAGELERRHRQIFEHVHRCERAADLRAGVMGAAGWGLLRPRATWPRWRSW